VVADPALVRLTAGPVQRDRAWVADGRAGDPAAVATLTDSSNLEFQPGAKPHLHLGAGGFVSIRCFAEAAQQIHGPSFSASPSGCGAACLIPLLIWSCCRGPLLKLDAMNLLTLFYVRGVSFPSPGLSVLPSLSCSLNRAPPPTAPRRSSIGAGVRSAMAIVFLGERPHLFHIIGFALVLTGRFSFAVAEARGESLASTDFFFFSLTSFFFSMFAMLDDRNRPAARGVSAHADHFNSDHP